MTNHPTPDGLPAWRGSGREGWGREEDEFAEKMAGPVQSNWTRPLTWTLAVIFCGICLAGLLIGAAKLIGASSPWSMIIGTAFIIALLIAHYWLVRGEARRK